jgi:nucleotide-binding universal stress UspA family protein
LPDSRRLAGPDGEIVLLHDVNHPSHDPRIWPNGTNKQAEEAKVYLEAQAQALNAQGIKTQVQTVVLNDISLSIDEAARIFHVDVIACATHGRGPVGRLVRGGVAWRMLAHSAVPVLLRHFEGAEEAEAESDLAPRRILVPLDGSPLAETAVPLATKLAQEWNAQVFLLWVIPDLPPASYPYGRLYLAPRNYEAESREAREYLDGLAAKMPVDVHTQVVLGGVIDSLVTMVGDLSISDIVMASHGRTGLSRVIVGSIADALVHRLTCPILIVPAIAAKRMEAEATPPVQPASA